MSLDDLSDHGAFKTGNHRKSLSGGIHAPFDKLNQTPPNVDEGRVIYMYLSEVAWDGRRQMNG